MTSDSSRPPVPAELEALDVAAVAVLSAVSRADEWDAATRRRVLTLLDKVANTVVVSKGRVVTAEAAAGTWALKGDRDLAGFLGRESRQGRGAGRAQVGQAATLSAMPVVADALVGGPVTVKHVEEITRATAVSPKLAAELAAPAGQARVVELARRLDGADFGKALKRMSAALDPASRQREHDAQRAARYLLVCHTSGGTLIKAQLDSVAGHRFVKAIDALSPRPAADDERDRGQRQVDSLMVMVDRALADKQTTPGVTAPVQALVVLREETWAALRAARGTTDVDRAPGRGSAGDLLPRLRGVDAVTDETGQAWPASEVGRALCDCALTRVVVDAPGRVLNLGRDERLFGRAQWLALYAGGQTTCAVDGCGMPLRFTELHHIAWWDRDNGPTDLENCAPECSFHHGEVHRLDLRITRRPDGSYEHRHPDGRPYGETPGGSGPSGPFVSVVVPPAGGSGSRRVAPVSDTG